MTMIDFLKENLTSEDMKMLSSELEFNFPHEDDFDSDYCGELANKCRDLGIEFKQVKQYGGEGSGDEYWYVFSCTKDGETKLFRLDGWYQSYEGYNFDDPMGFYEVVPKERAVIFYEKP